MDKFRYCEYATPEDETWIWRHAFLREVSNQAPYILQELADIFLESFGKSDFSDTSRLQPTQEQIRICSERLAIWAIKYGLAENQEGGFAEWVAEIIIKTWQCWRRSRTVNSRFAQRIPKGSIREMALVLLYVLEPEAMRAMRVELRDSENLPVDLETFIKEKCQVIKEEAGNIDFIPPPKTFPIWFPLFQTKDEYLKIVESMGREQIRLDQRLSQLSAKTRADIIAEYKKMALQYCKKLEEHYQKYGYKRLPRKRVAARQISWTVQVQVLGRSMNEVARQSDYPVQGVLTQVHEVLSKINLALRDDRRRGRQLGAGIDTQS